MSSLGFGVRVRLPTTKYNSSSGFCGLLLDRSTTELKNHTRSMHLALPRHSKTDPLAETDKVSAKSIRFSTSKGSHHAWTVNRSMGSIFQRPWWKVIPVSLAGMGILMWAMFHKGSDVDTPGKKSVVQTPA